MMGAVLDLVRVLYEPGAVFERVREKPKFLAPWLGLALVLVVISFLQLPYIRAALAGQMAAAAQANPQAAAAAQKFAFVGVIVAPIALAVILVINAAILWVLVSVLGEEAKFGTLLSVATYAAMAGMLLQVAGLAVLMIKGTGGVSSMEDIRPALGLDLLAPGTTGFVGGVLKGINPFTIWALVLTAIGISTTHKTSKGTAYTVATIAALLAVVVGAVLAGFGSGARAG